MTYQFIVPVVKGTEKITPSYQFFFAFLKIAVTLHWKPTDFQNPIFK
jgi:hypothetical protein